MIARFQVTPFQESFVVEKYYSDCKYVLVDQSVSFASFFLFLNIFLVTRLPVQTLLSRIRTTKGNRKLNANEICNLEKL